MFDPEKGRLVFTEANGLQHYESTSRPDEETLAKQRAEELAAEQAILDGFKDHPNIFRPRDRQPDDEPEL